MELGIGPSEAGFLSRREHKPVLECPATGGVYRENRALLPRYDPANSGTLGNRLATAAGIAGNKTPIFLWRLFCPRVEARGNSARGHSILFYRYFESRRLGVDLSADG